MIVVEDVVLLFWYYDEYYVFFWVILGGEFLFGEGYVDVVWCEFREEIGLDLLIGVWLEKCDVVYVVV